MISWDQWRESYDDLSYMRQLKYYDKIYEKYPKQNHCTISQAKFFFRTLSMSRPVPQLKVLEVGGWNGAVADCMLEEFPNIRHWTNYEICQSAISRGRVHCARYMSIVPNKFVWDMYDLPHTDIFFASHTLEHMKVEQVDLLISQLISVTDMYLEVPIPDSSTNTSWLGYSGTHILEIGWEQLEKLLQKHGFHVTWTAKNIRFLER